jgi:hypothetical protein
MKVSEITAEHVAKYLEIEYDATTQAERTMLDAVLKAAKAFIVSYTGIPETTTEPGVKTLDDYDDIYIVVMILCQDMYDNRSLYTDNEHKNSINKVVDMILGMHCKNLL